MTVQTHNISYRNAFYAGFGERKDLLPKQILAVEGLVRYVFGATVFFDSLKPWLTSTDEFFATARFFTEEVPSVTTITVKTGLEKKVAIGKLFSSALKVSGIALKLFKATIASRYDLGLILARGVADITLNSYDICKTFNKTSESRNVRWSKIAMSTSIICVTIFSTALKAGFKASNADLAFTVFGLLISGSGFSASFFDSVEKQAKAAKKV